MIIIKNANLVNMSDIYYENRDILIDDGKIKHIGTINEASYDATVIDAKGRMVTPGLVESHCHIGLREEAVGPVGDDVNEFTNPIMPEIRGIDAVKPQDSAFSAAARAGVTTVVTGPGSGEVIGGTFCALKTYGKTVLDMVIKEEVAMKMALGENPKRVFGTKGQAPFTRMCSAALMREALINAKKYYDKKKKYEQETVNGNKDAVEPEFNMKLESLSRVFNGMKVKIHAHQQDDIVTALRIIDEFGLDATIDHCTEGYIIPEVLKQKNQRIIIGPTLGSKTKIELRNMTFDGGIEYVKHGIEFALMTDHPVIPLENALVQGALYVKHGVDELEVLKALTINAAKLTGIDDRVGSIEVGKDADIVIWSDNPFNYLAKPDMVLINGNVIA